MRSTLVFVLLSVLVTAAEAADWPQWRGPARDGVAPEIPLSREWPAKAPQLIWRTFVGAGYSSPVFQDGRVFLMALDNDGLETCLGLDAATGKELWRHSYQETFKPSDPTAGSWPKSTPTVDGDRVYMLGLGGMFHCFATKTGRILWKHDFHTQYWGVEKDQAGDDAWFPACGAAASPLVDGKLVIVPVGGKKAGALTAFDRNTGAIVWQELSERSSYASPMIAEIAGTRQIVAFTGLRMVGLNATTHELLWDYPFPALYEQTIISPVIWKDIVIVSGERKPTVALRIEKQAGKIARSIAWENNDLRAYLTTPVIVEGHLIGLDDRLKRLVCVNLHTGLTTWTSERLDRYVSLVIAGRKLLVLNSDGELHVLEANPQQYLPLHKWQVSEQGRTWAHLAIVGKRLFIKDNKHLLCFDLAA